MTYKVKEAIKSFTSYKPNTLSYKVKLDANESNRNLDLLTTKLDLSSINRYPDNYAVELRQDIANDKQVDLDNVMVGAGSSELLDLIVKTFVNPNDIVLSVEPSFVMYKKYTMISNGIYNSVPESEKTIDDLISLGQDDKVKVIFLCTPNNPTGKQYSKEDVIRLIKNVKAIVVVDEAYMEFSSSNPTVISEINTYPNLIVNRTFSKAYAIAGARLGYIIANKELIETLQIIKTPYSVSSLTQELGRIVLQDKKYIQDNIKMITFERQRLSKIFDRLQLHYRKSETNFFYLEFNQFDLGKALQKRGVLIRDFNNGFYRITIGTRKENDLLVKALEDSINENI